MYFLELEMTAGGFGLIHTFYVCVWRVRLPTCQCFLSLTNNVDNQFWLVSSTTLQYPNFYHSVISIFDGTRQSVNINSLLEIQWKSRPRWRLKLVKVVDPTFIAYIIVLCPQNNLNNTGTPLNWIPCTDNLCKYLTPAWFPFFFDVFLKPKSLSVPTKNVLSHYTRVV